MCIKTRNKRRCTHNATLHKEETEKDMRSFCRAAIKSLKNKTNKRMTGVTTGKSALRQDVKSVPQRDTYENYPT